MSGIELWVVIPSFVLKDLNLKCEDGWQEEVSQKPSDYAAVTHVQMQVNFKADTECRV